jgi:hypothetical protein
MRAVASMETLFILIVYFEYLRLCINTQIAPMKQDLRHHIISYQEFDSQKWERPSQTHKYQKKKK